MKHQLRLTAIAFMLTLAGSLIAVFAPLYTEVSSSSVPVDVEMGAETVRHLNMVQTDGWGSAIPVAIPVVLALVTVVLDAVAIHKAWSRRPILVTGAVLLAIWTVLSLASVGFVFVPATVAMAISAARAGGAANERPATAV